MKDKLLLPIDGSEIFSETMTYLEELGREQKYEIVLMHVQAGSGETDGPADGADHPLLMKYYQALKAAGWPVSAVVCTGEPTQQIAREAQTIDPAMLIMSTHGRSGFERIREGSVTEQVVRQSPCPVFVLHSAHSDIRPGAGKQLFRRMLVPLDGSETSSAILPCVEKFAKRYQTHVVLFHDHPDCDTDSSASTRREYISRCGVDLANAGVSVQLDCSTRQLPVREILRRTDDLDIDLVAMITHGTGGGRRPLEESVTASIMRHSSRPLLVWSADPQCRFAA